MDLLLHFGGQPVFEEYPHRRAVVHENLMRSPLELTGERTFV
jgi:hypothetical protein